MPVESERLRATVSEPTRPAADQLTSIATTRAHAAAGFVVIARLAPDFDEDVVQQILRLAPIAEDAAADGQERRRVAVIQSR